MIIDPSSTKTEFNNTNNTNKTKITVITAIFNKFDILREPLIVNKNIKYICITDDPTLKSNVWKIIVNPSNINKRWSGRKKTYYVRYHPFEFCDDDTDYCFWVDASIQLNKFDFEYYANTNKDIIAIYTQEISKFASEYLFNFSKDYTLKNPDNCKFLYINTINFANMLNCIYKKYKNAKNIDKIYSIFGALRGYKNNKLLKEKLVEVFNTLLNVEPIKNSEIGMYYDYRIVGDILFYDEPFAGIILNDFSAIKLGFFDTINTDLLKMYCHNTYDLRSIF